MRTRHVSVFLGSALREARKNRGLSINDTARLAHISSVALAKVEAGERDLPVSALFTLASTVGVSIESLFPDPSKNDISEGLEFHTFMVLMARLHPGVRAELSNLLQVLHETAPKMGHAAVRWH